MASKWIEIRGKGAGFKRAFPRGGGDAGSYG
jgi:hypothetical protein